MLRQKLGVIALVAIFFGILTLMVIAGGKLQKKEEEKLKEKDDKDKGGVD